MYHSNRNIISVVNILSQYLVWNKAGSNVKTRVNYIASISVYKHII